MRISKLAAVCAASALLAGAAQGAPVQWNSGAGANGHWYDIVFSALTWGQAEAAAASMTNLGQTGYLATVTSAEEQAFLNALNPNNTGAWLGGTDQNVEGTWEWITGEAWTYNNWYSGEPNDQFGEDYLAGWWSGTTFWNDLPGPNYAGSNIRAYIVEYNTAAVPLPAGLPLLIGALGVLGLAARRRKAG